MENQLPLTVRIPTEVYGYVEVTYPSAKDYAEKHPELIRIIEQTMKKISKNREDDKLPF